MSENNKGILQFVGVDDGHYGIKICAGEGKYVHIKSRATYGVHQSISINGTRESFRAGLTILFAMTLFLFTSKRTLFVGKKCSR